MASSDQSPPSPSSPTPRPGWRTADLARAALIALAVWFGLQLLWTVSSLVFLIFLGTLFGLAVGRGADLLERYRIRRGVGAALIVFSTLAVIIGMLSWTAPTLIEQGQELQRQVPAAIQKLQAWLASKNGGVLGTLIQSATDAVSSASPEGVASGAAKYLFSFLSNTLAVFAAAVLLIFLSIYVGAEPEVYEGWILATVPATSRAQVRIVMGRIATVLRKWLVTQLIAMVVIGVVSMIALLLLDVKAAFALAFIAGLLEFVPTVGPVLSAVPAILMAFVDSPEKALAVVFVYWGIQFMENNLLIPYLMRGEMDLPPAITIVAQTLMTLLFGFVGLMVAVPLTSAVLVPIRMINERESEKEAELLRITASRRVPHKKGGP